MSAVTRLARTWAPVSPKRNRTPKRKSRIDDDAALREAGWPVTRPGQFNA